MFKSAGDSDQKNVLEESYREKEYSSQPVLPTRGLPENIQYSD